MKCSKGSIDGQGFIACGAGKLSTQDYEELQKYIQFRKDRHKRLLKKEKTKNEKHTN